MWGMVYVRSWYTSSVIIWMYFYLHMDWCVQSDKFAQSVAVFKVVKKKTNYIF